MLVVSWSFLYKCDYSESNSFDINLCTGNKGFTHCICVMEIFQICERFKEKHFPIIARVAII